MKNLKNLKGFILGILACFLLGAGFGKTVCDYLYVNNYIDIVNTAAPAVSAAGTSRIYSDSTGNAVYLSQNGGAYSPLIPGRNVIINGDFKINQRNQTQIISASAYQIDRWNMVINTPNSGTFSSSTNLNTNIALTTPVLRTNSTGAFQCNNANTSVSAGTNLLIRQTIEAKNIPQSFVNNGIVLSFYVTSTLVGNFGVSLHDITNSKSVMTGFTITNTNTWQQFSFPFTGWTNIGDLEFDICLIGGSNFAGATSTVFGTATNSFYTPSSPTQTNFGSSSSNIITFTGVQIEDGSKPTPFEYRSYPQELALCQRYCCVYTAPGGANNFPLANGYVSAPTVVDCLFNFPVPMRVAPTFTLGTGTNIAHLSCGQPSVAAVVTTSPPVTNGHFGGGPTALAAEVRFTASTLVATANNAGFVFWNSSATTADQLVFNADY